MLGELRSKVAVVTGAGSGIGAALCRGFAARGMQVVAADIDLDAATATADELPEAIAVEVDVADQTSVDALADAAFAHFGQVDLLCNNAGVFQGGLMWERSTEDWDWIMGVNVMGIVHGVQAFVPRMMAQDTDGHVVNTASVAAFVAGPMSSPYIVSKAAAFSITECLALDLAAAGSKIGASVLVPSAFDTGIARTAGVRPDRYGVDDSAEGAAVADALASMLREGQHPDAIVEPVVEAITSGTFVIPTRPSYQDQIENRFAALRERRLPDLSTVD